MDIYEKATRARRTKQKEINARVKEALGGLTPRNAGLVFDLSQGEKGHKLDDTRNAGLKAIELVHGLLDSFGLPVRPQIQYRGVIKQAETSEGMSDGVIKLGATIQTLLGHKANIDIPVVVRDKMLLEPAVFFYNETPYVLCGPAVEQLIKGGSLMKDMQPRGMYSPPLSGQAAEANLPRQPITNLEHMFSPGPRNPWHFRRSDKQADGKQVLMDAPSEKRERGDEARKELTQKGPMVQYPGSFGLEDPDAPEIWETKETEVQEPEREFVTSLEELDVEDEPVIESGDDDLDWLFRGESEDDLYQEYKRSAVKKEFDAIFKIAGEPRPRTNIEAPVECVELWQDDVKDEYLDPAERDRSELCKPGKTIKLTQDVKVKERGGGTLTLPKGEKGTVMKSLEGDGKMLVVCFDKMRLTATIPTRYCKGSGKSKKKKTKKKKAASVDQVKNEVREMLREGYQKIDIKEAIARKYPNQAVEALRDLD